MLSLASVSPKDGDDAMRGARTKTLVVVVNRGGSEGFGGAQCRKGGSANATTNTERNSQVDIAAVQAVLGLR